jgi:hypothetical protein
MLDRRLREELEMSMRREERRWEWSERTLLKVLVTLALFLEPPETYRVIQKQSLVIKG